MGFQMITQHQKGIKMNQIVKVEELFLTETFGGEYLCYKKKICRYLGRKSRGF